MTVSAHISAHSTRRTPPRYLAAELVRGFIGGFGRDNDSHPDSTRDVVEAFIPLLSISSIAVRFGTALRLDLP